MIIQETLSEKKAVILQLFIKIRKKNKKKNVFSQTQHVNRF